MQVHMKLGEKLLQTCSSRLSINPSGKWAFTVQLRINHCIDFITAETRYHHHYQLQF